MSGQRKLNAGHHLSFPQRCSWPLSRSLSAGLGHGAICAQPPLRPMAYKPVARGGTLKIQIQRKRTITRLRPSGFRRARARGDIVDAFRFTDRLSEDGRRLLWARRSVKQAPQMDAGPESRQRLLTSAAITFWRLRHRLCATAIVISKILTSTVNVSDSTKVSGKPGFTLAFLFACCMGCLSARKRRTCNSSSGPLRSVGY